MITNRQLNRLARGYPLYVPASFSAATYLTTEIQAGDPVAYSPAPPNGFPILSNTSVIYLSGVSQGSAYTTTLGDVGKPLNVVQTLTGPLNSPSQSSPSVTVIQQQSAYNNFIIGSNTTEVHNYELAYCLNNGAQGGNFPTDLSDQPIPAASIGSTGWPLVPFRFVITQAKGTSDGQLPHGTRSCSYRLLAAQPGWVAGAAGSSTVSGDGNGATVSNLQLQSDNITVNFTLVTAALSNPRLNFTGGAAYVDIPRDGVTPTWGGPEFSPDCIDRMKLNASIRMMDFNRTIPQTQGVATILAGQVCIIYSTGTTDFTLLGAANNNAGTQFTATGAGTGSGSVLIPEIIWANRVPDYGTTGPGGPFSLERELRFINTVTNATGSRIRSMYYNIGGFVSPGYAANAATLFNSILAVSVPIYMEIGNEPWNTASTIYPVYSAMAQAECQTIATYGVAASNLLNVTGGSVTGNGVTTTVTIGTGFAMPSFVTVGAQFYVGNQDSATWSQDSTGTAYSLSNLATVIAVTATTFTYASKGNGTMSGTDRFKCYFNPASTLLQDKLNFDIFALIFKWYVRQMYVVWTAFNAAGRSDRFVFNLQMYSSSGQGSAQNLPIHFKYGTYIANNAVPGTNLNTWVSAAAIAPYIKAMGRYASASTATPNQIFGVPFAAYAQPGDSITISGIGAGGASLATTVGTGSSGTTLVITGSVVTNVPVSLTNPPTIVYTNGDSTAILNAMIYGGLPILEVAARTHAYACNLYGLRMMAYESSIDIQAIPTQQAAIVGNSLVGTVISDLFDMWYGCGGQELYAFTAVPGVITNTIGGSWNWLASWTDTTSPRVAALIAYTQQRVYNNIFSPSPGAPPAAYALKFSGVGNSLADCSAMAGQDSTGANFGTNAVNGMAFWSNNTGARNLDWNVVFPRAARYSAVVSGTDTVAGTVVQVWLDNVQVGTATLVANGSPVSNGTVPGDSTFFNMTGGAYLDLATSGQHNLSIRCTGSAPSKGVVPGIFSVIFTRV